MLELVLLILGVLGYVVGIIGCCMAWLWFWGPKRNIAPPDLPPRIEFTGDGKDLELLGERIRSFKNKRG
jgi:hypothetical protein